MINITSFAKAKKTNNTTSTNSGFSNNVTVNKTTANGVNIWGQYHDHTKDIDGDFSTSGNINAEGDIKTSSNVECDNVIAHTNISSNGTLNVSGDSVVNDIRATDCYVTNILTCDDFTASNGQITELLTTDITVDNLTVQKAAHFFELIVDTIKSTQGQIIISPSNADIVDVTFDSTNNAYTLYFYAQDEQATTQILNTFAVNDQILCQTFNAAEGTSYDVSNRFYWAVCSEVSSTPIKREINGQKYYVHYIKLNWNIKDSNTNTTPQIGDEIVVLGNTTDTTRQNAISIGAYNNSYLDSAIQAPFIIQYIGINDFNLSTHRKNTISNGFNDFYGNFNTNSGDTISDLINGLKVSVSQIQQTSDDIQLKVSALNGGTDNLFNFSSTTWENAVPFIQGYGAEIIADGGKISNMELNDIGGYITITFDAKMQNSNATVNVTFCGVEAEDDNSTQTINTTWTSKKYFFKNIPNSLRNGYITFSGDITNSNRMYIKNLMINRGNVPMAFGISNIDYSQNKDEDNVVDNWNYNQIAKQETTHKGYSIYESDTIVDTNNTIDFIYSNNNTLEQNQPYSLSFYAKTKNANELILTSFFFNHGGCINGTISDRNYDTILSGETSVLNWNDGATYYKINGEWRHYIIHWYNQNAGNRDIIVARIVGSINSNQDYLQICGIEIRKGYWTEEQTSSTSLIKQTANDIELKVKNTGINIDDGTITLNADNTTINGNLNLYNKNNNGLTLFDANSIDRINIQPKNIETLIQESNLEKNKYFFNCSYLAEGTSYNITTDTNTAVNLTKGQFIEFTSKQEFWIYSQYDVYQYYPTDNTCTLTFSLIKDNVTFLTFDETAYKENELGIYSTAFSKKILITEDGEYHFTITVSNLTDSLENGSYVYFSTVKLYGYNKTQATLLGQDGFLFKTGADTYIKGTYDKLTTSTANGFELIGNLNLTNNGSLSMNGDYHQLKIQHDNDGYVINSSGKIIVDTNLKLNKPWFYKVGEVNTQLSATSSEWKNYGILKLIGTSGTTYTHVLPDDVEEGYTIRITRPNSSSGTHKITTTDTTKYIFIAGTASANPATIAVRRMHTLTYVAGSWFLQY